MSFTERKAFGQNKFDKNKGKKFKDGKEVKKRVKKLKTRKDRRKERLKPRVKMGLEMVDWSPSFLNDICRANGIPILTKDGWKFKSNSF